jgi:hypothetical protein
MISTDAILKKIENVSQNDLQERILYELEQSDKKMIEGDFESFLDFLKNNYLYMQYICEETYGKARLFLIKIVKCFNINNININETLELIRDNATYAITRCSDWNISKIPLVNNSLNRINIKCVCAEVKYVNKWGDAIYPSTYKIIYDGKKVLWIKNTYEEPQYFILKSEKIYGISYKHKFITIYNCIDILCNEFGINNNTNFDEIISNYDKMHPVINEFIIDLSEYFYKGFFYKGTLFDRNWKQEISKLKSIEFINGLVKIEIENLTYPHVGYVLLEIENNKIIEARKY